MPFLVILHSNFYRSKTYLLKLACFSHILNVVYYVIYKEVFKTYIGNKKFSGIRIIIGNTRRPLTYYID